jgi:PAS domain S-box-containing protein
MTAQPSLLPGRSDPTHLEAENIALQERLRQLDTETKSQAARLDSLERELASARKDLEFALWGGSLALWKVNLQTRQVEFSDGWYRIHEFDRESVGSGLAELESLIHPEDAERHRRTHLDHLAGNATHTELEYRIRGGDGKWRWVYERSYVVERDANGQPLIMAGTQYEITERKRMEQAEREHALRFQAFMDNMPAVMFIKDAQGRYLFGNRAWAAQFDRPPSKLLNATDADLWPPETAEVFRTSDRQLLESRQVQQTVETAGSQVFAVTKFPIPNSDGTLLLGGVVADITKTVHIEKQLRESEERFRDLAQSVGLIPWEWDCSEDRYSYVGPQAEQILGYPMSAWQEPKFWERALYPEDQERTLAACRERVQSSDNYELEYRLVRADGAVIWIQDIASVYRELGQPRKVRGYSIDITQRKLTELKLLESESRMRSLAAHVPDTIILIDTEMRIEYINRLGPVVEEKQVIGSCVLDWLPPEAQAAPRKAIERTLREGLGGEYTAPTIDYGAGVTWYSVHVGPVIVDGVIQGAVLIARNINEQRRVSEALRASEERYRLLADHSTDVIALLAPDLTLKYVSPACRAMLGFEPEQMVGRNALEFVPAEDMAVIAADYSRFLKENRSLPYACRLKRQDGGGVWVEPKGQVRYDPATGEVLEVIASVRNIDERMAADRQLREREAQLAHVARLSTLGEIATELAHEINQPLYAISNFSDACLANFHQVDDESRADVLHWIGAMGLQARRAADTVRRFGRFARKGDFEISTFDLNDCVRDVMPLVDFELRRQGINFSFNAATTPLFVRAERVLLEQVIMNLLRNAIEAMETVPATDHRLVLETYRTSQGQFGLSLVDSGPGITGDPARLFEAYVTTKPKGAGIGLGICRTTIESLGGRIWASNAPARGARFEFCLPPAPVRSA